MNYKNKQIGIWGFGRTGQAIAKFLQDQEASVIIYDDNPARVPSGLFTSTQSREKFFDQSEFIVPSPGVDIRPYKDVYHGTWLAELDLFQQFFHKPIIAVTGSVGKTTVTHLLAHALQLAGWSVEAAGNIGTPCLEIVSKQTMLDAVVLEVSSFQLEHINSFAPDLALWTNFYPNHLDRHSTMQDYFRAKCNSFKRQNSNQTVLLPLNIRDMLINTSFSSTAYFFSEQADLHNEKALFCIEKECIVFHKESTSHVLIDTRSLDQSVFSVNWLIIYAALYLLRIPLRPLQSVTTIEHRLEHVATVGTVSFYNDSKSTTPASTVAALQQIRSPRTILFLGGLSKGVDRFRFIELLASKPLYVLCFGAEAESLRSFCDRCSIISCSFATLEDAFTWCVTILQPHDCILFSPAGSSFDLFENYQARGACFKRLVKQYQESLRSP